MMILTLLMFSIFDSIQENPGTAATIVFGVVGWSVQVGIFIWKMSQVVAKVNELAKSFNTHEAAFDQHKVNADVHTTREQRESLGREIGHLRDSQSRDFAAINTKLDTLMLHFIDKAK
jgi:hypothetical protein